MKKTFCIWCDNELKLGDFAYYQEICWECFKAEIKIMLDKCEHEEHKDILRYMLNVVAETFYGNKWKEKSNLLA